MRKPDTRLIQYDETPTAERDAILARLFDHAEELELVRQFLADPLARPVLEFMLLDAVPYEEFVRDCCINGFGTDWCFEGV
jgi:hypothetical protein